MVATVTIRLTGQNQANVTVNMQFADPDHTNADVTFHPMWSKDRKEL